MRQAWRNTRDLGQAQGWAWPSLPTIQRRWQALGMVDLVALRLGREKAVRRLAQPALRDKTSIIALEWVSLARLTGRIGGRRTSGWTSAKVR